MECTIDRRQITDRLRIQHWTIDRWWIWKRSQDDGSGSLWYHIPRIWSISRMFSIGSVGSLSDLCQMSHQLWYRDPGGIHSLCVAVLLNHKAQVIPWCETNMSASFVEELQEKNPRSARMQKIRNSQRIENTFKPGTYTIKTNKIVLFYPVKETHLEMCSEDIQ